MSGLAEQIKEYGAELAKPISDASAAGSDVSFEPAFEAVKGELDKLSSVSGGIVDWQLVAQRADDITKTMSKDVRVLVWLVMARFKTEGAKGLALGLSACRDVTAQHWDAMFPPVKRARARGNQFEWLFERLDEEVPGVAVTAADKEALETAAELARELDSFVSDKLGDHYTAVPRTSQLLKQRAGEVAAPEPPAPSPQPRATTAPVTSTPVAAAPAPVAAPAEPVVIAGAQGATTALRNASTTIKAAALEFRRENSARALAYTLPRIATWLLAERLPPTTSGQRTAVPAPRDKARLEALAANEKWNELLTAAEELASGSVFWLDPHRFSALALERLGPSHADAKRALEREVAHFVARLPGITELQFADGSPFADAGCVAWLDGIVGSEGGSGGGGGKHEQLSEEDAEVVARFEAAKELVAAGKVDEGLELAHALSCRAPTPRARFRARVEVATLALRGNKATLVCAILEALVREGEQHRLDDWEPELSAQVYAALLTARRAAGAGNASGGTAGAGGASAGAAAISDDELLARLCRLAPAQALRLAGR
jgi:type VI secretion system protein VasJ